MVVVLTFPLRQELLGAARVHGGMVEGGSMASSGFFICCHSLWGVDTRKSVAKGHHGILVVGAAGRYHFHISTRTLQAVIRPLLLKASVEQALGVGGGDGGLPRHASFHLQMVEDSLLANVWQGAGRPVHECRRTAAGLLTGLKISNCIQSLATEEQKNTLFFD